MNSNLNFPSIDHLIEGVHYTIVDWDFAQQAPSRTPGTPCPSGEKVVFGVCRKVGGSREKDFDSGKKTAQEESLEKASGKAVKTKEEAVAANKQGFQAGGKKYGWAIKGGKPVIVEWGSVAGTKPKVPTAAPATTSPKPQNPAAPA
jgi:hypothetical protein